MQVVSKHAKKYRVYLIEIPMIALIGVILFFGAFWQYFDVNMRSDNPQYYSDVAKYECYAHGFWQGTSGLTQFPSRKCGFLESYSSAQPFRTLPKEYPLLVLIPFSLPLLVPTPFYNIAFACLMTLLVGVIYIVLKRTRSTSAAIAFLVYLLLGCWSTAAGRFDLVPAMFTLLAVIYAEKKHWRWAFALLAIATMFKFYPVILVPVFLIAQQADDKSVWYSWRRVQPLAIFAGICAGITLLSLVLNVDGTLAPFSYFKDRPIQVESLSASLLWLTSILQHSTLHNVYSFGSYNVIGASSSLISQGGTILFVFGLVYTCWLQWRGKIALPLSVLLTLLVVMVTGKVFSPQYLIWVAPLIAYIAKANWKWFLGWGSLSVITMCVYPILYLWIGVTFLPVLIVSFVRNVLLLLFMLTLFFYASCRTLIVAPIASDKPTVHDEKYA